ncbi:hypothetical protein LTR53_002588, partial [Teratosphaeriaceae sp. CCFEE 6253]
DFARTRTRTGPTMWLIDTATLRLKHTIHDDQYRYAILSHTWGEDEVTHQDLLNSPETAKQKAGYMKIEFTCAQARKDSLAYVWVDTCCIDKTSSAEFSEASSLVTARDAG